MSPMSMGEQTDIKKEYKELASKMGKIARGGSLEVQHSNLSAKYSLDFNGVGFLEVFSGKESLDKVSDAQADGALPTVFSGAYGGPQLDIFLENDNKSLRITGERDKTIDNTNARVVISEIE